MWNRFSFIVKKEIWASDTQNLRFSLFSIPNIIGSIKDIIYNTVVKFIVSEVRLVLVPQVLTLSFCHTIKRFQT